MTHVTTPSDTLTSNIRAAFATPDLPEATKILVRFETAHTGPWTSQEKEALTKHYLTLTRIYTAIELPSSALGTAWKVLDTYGFVIKRYPQLRRFYDFELVTRGHVIERVVEAWIHIWKAYVHLRLASETMRDDATQFAWWACNECHGDEKFFEEERDTLIPKPMFEGRNLADALIE